jgi:hypothetical protein
MRGMTNRVYESTHRFIEGMDLMTLKVKYCGRETLQQFADKRFTLANLATQFHHYTDKSTNKGANTRTEHGYNNVDNWTRNARSQYLKNNELPPALLDYLQESVTSHILKVAKSTQHQTDCRFNSQLIRFIGRYASPLSKACSDTTTKVWKYW